MIGFRCAQMQKRLFLVLFFIGYYNILYNDFMNIKDIIVSLFLVTPHEMAVSMARQVQAKRLSFNLSQKTLAERSGVSFGVLKKFERTGKISLESLLKIALVLDSLAEFQGLFQKGTSGNFTSLDELLKDTKRKRGRK